MKRILALFLVIVACFTLIPVTAGAAGERTVVQSEMRARQLKQLGLFKGVSETNFDLSRAPTRAEAVVMLIRLLGKESTALSEDWNHPFTDVPDWADRYIGYAYCTGLTNGQSATTFGMGDASASMYLTFVLRALGYSDENGTDFTWDDPYSLAKITGILSGSIDTMNFWRADVVLISYNSLDAYIKNTDTPLYRKLIHANVFTEEQYLQVTSVTGITDNNSGDLSSERIAEVCSPAVFYVECYDEYDELYCNGSGFFIDDKGTAVTNHHVLEDVSSAYIKLKNGKVYEILGVYDYNEQQDWAVVKTSCEDSYPLAMADSDSIKQGQEIYTIGSPRGLENTLSDGIISNVSREFSGTQYIQFTAPTSMGSSGGALLDAHGQVIGITTAGIESGENLNLAVPINLVKNYNSAEAKPLPITSSSTSVGAPSDVTEGHFPVNSGNAVFDALADSTIIYSDGYDTEDNCYLYSYSNEEYDLLYGSIYYPDLELITIILVVEDTYGINFTISPNVSETALVAYLNKETSSAGVAAISPASFTADSEYVFSEYQGTDRAKDEELAHTCHYFAAIMLDSFISFTSDGKYTIADLGYTSYASDEEMEFYTEDEIFEKCSPALFYIEAYDGNDEMISSGTGFFIDNLGVAVTSYSVIKDSQSAKVRLYDGKICDVIGVIDYDEDQNWAVISVDCGDTKTPDIALADLDSVVEGTKVYYIGNSITGRSSIGSATLDDASVSIDGYEYFGISAQISSSYIGGMLVDDKGTFLGMISASYSYDNTIVIPYDEFSDYDIDAEPTPLNVLFEESESNEISAFDVLALSLALLAPEYDEVWGYEYVCIDEDDVYFELSYTPEDETITVFMIYTDERNETYSIQYYIDSDCEETSAIYNRYNSNSVSVARGEKYFECASYINNFNYVFDEYNGSMRSVDQTNAEALHTISLSLLNNVLESVCEAFEIEAFTVADLGYTSFYFEI